MTDTAVYVFLTLFLLLILIAQYILSQFFKRSLNNKRIDRSDEHRTMWRWIAMISCAGLLFNLSFSISPEMIPTAPRSVLELVCIPFVVTLGFSVFAFILFWVIDALLRQRIKDVIKKETDNIEAD